jgi:hypothetical protein
MLSKVENRSQNKYERTHDINDTLPNILVESMTHKIESHRKTILGGKLRVINAVGLGHEDALDNT